MIISKLSKITGLVLTMTLLTSALSAKTVHLFNGKDLSNWVRENNAQFSVEDGVIKLNRGRGWLRSKEEFKDFSMTMEFRFLEERANSGIYVRTKNQSNDDAQGYPNSGYQVQCMNALSGDVPLGRLFPYEAPDFLWVLDRDALHRAYLPTNEWNTYEITCIGDTISVKLNGILITLGFGMSHPKGHIGIQGELGLLEFRRVDVKVLPSPSNQS